MTVKIGHSSIDERGKASGGKAGDQTGRELCVRDWYRNGWTVLLRPKDPEIAERMALACEAGCRNENIGYDQDQRNTLRARAREVGWDLSKIKTPCECDCSSFMAVCAEAAGVSMDWVYISGNAPTTRNMRVKFWSTGAFEVYAEAKYLSSPEYLRRGDVLVYEGHHTVMVLSDGPEGAREKEQEELENMTGREILNKINADLAREPVPEWAEAELEEAIRLGITDGTSPMTLIPRYQAAMMAVRAVKAALKEAEHENGQ